LKTRKAFIFLILRNMADHSVFSDIEVEDQKVLKRYKKEGWQALAEEWECEIVQVHKSGWGCPTANARYEYCLQSVEIRRLISVIKNHPARNFG
jgi:hypothetical protein